MTYTVVLRAEPEGGYTVLVPALPEVVSCGNTLEEARRMAEDAIRCALLARKDLGETLPDEGPDTLLSISLDDLTGSITICRVSVALGEPAVA